MDTTCPYCGKDTATNPCTHCGTSWGDFSPVRAAKFRSDYRTGSTAGFALVFIRCSSRPSLTGEHPGRKNDVERGFG